MPNRRGPTLRSRSLGKQLRELRESANLTLQEVASYMQRDPSSISRMETGVHPARIPDVLAYVTLCGESRPDRREQLVQLAQDAWQTGLWDRYGEDDLKALMDLTWLEARASEIRAFEAIVLPGLLQSPAYAAAVIRASDATRQQADIDRWVNVRLRRQEILDEPRQPRLHAVLDESVLHRVVGGKHVMREQLLHLVETARRPNVTISVLPWGTGAHASPEGCFNVLFMDEPYTDVGYMETPTGPVFVERDEVEKLIDRHDRLSRAALGDEESIALTLQIAEEMDT
ncbi:helix-turn-helix domain-containing protein [Paractinoplanes globisporus]|uniref:Helix-turn-helix domain-containing protein n=1 Tax=Paractinoplanes globisporus TaxID=113565 RepID=A0ABW6W6U7_9ACTN|nr:helix-turn-helix transcriptional regulator [Actinoplanes globisporus]